MRAPEIRPAQTADVPALSRLRHALWPDLGPAGHAAELEAALAGPPGQIVVFVAEGVAAGGDGALIGFAEAALRGDHVNGCETTPVAFLEGIWVAPEHRQRGVARALAEAVEAWARSRGCREFASDAALDNGASHALLAALGFAETERVVFFRKAL